MVRQHPSGEEHTLVCVSRMVTQRCVPIIDSSNKMLNLPRFCYHVTHLNSPCMHMFTMLTKSVKNPEQARSRWAERHDNGYESVFIARKPAADDGDKDK